MVVFARTVLGLLRRPRVVVAAALVAITCAAGVGVLVPLTYTSSSTLLLATTANGSVVSSDGEPLDIENPLLGFDERLKGTVQFLVQSLKTPAAAAEMGAPKGGPTTIAITAVSDDPTLLGTEAPFLFIDAESVSSDQAVETVRRATDRVREELVTRQRLLEAPATTFVTLTEVVPPSAPAAQLGSKVQYVGVAGLFGFAAVLGGIYLCGRLDEAKSRWRRSVIGDRVATNGHGTPAVLAAAAFGPVPAAGNGAGPDPPPNGSGDRSVDGRGVTEAHPSIRPPDRSAPQLCAEAATQTRPSGPVGLDSGLPTPDRGADDPAPAGRATGQDAAPLAQATRKPRPRPQQPRRPQPRPRVTSNSVPRTEC